MVLDWYGLIVIFKSSHPPLFDWNAWSLRLRSSPGSITEDEFKEEASNLAFAFWDRIGESDYAPAVSSVLMRRRSGYN